MKHAIAFVAAFLLSGGAALRTADLQSSLDKPDSAVQSIDGGTLEVANTIVIRTKEGGGISGLPGGTSIVRGGYDGKPTELKWVGKPGGTMIRIEDSIQQTLSGLILDGNGTAGTLVEVTTGKRWGSAHTTFRDCTFKNAAVGVSFGQEADPTGSCNSDSQFWNCTWNNLTAGVRTFSDQSVNHVFYAGGFVNCGTGIDALRGGNVATYSTAAGATDTFMRIRGGGPNASKFTVYAARFEATGNSQAWMTIVDAQPSQGECNVLLIACQEGGANRAGAFDNSKAGRFVAGRGAIIDLQQHRHNFAKAMPVADVAAGGLFRDRNSIYSFEPADPTRWLGKGRIDIAGPTNALGDALRSFQR